MLLTLLALHLVMGLAPGSYDVYRDCNLVLADQRTETGTLRFLADDGQIDIVPAGQLQGPDCSQFVNVIVSNVIFNPNPPVCNQTYTVTFRISNIGTMLCPPTHAEATDEGVSVFEVAVPPISPGSYYTVPPQSMGLWKVPPNHTIFLIADSNNAVVESNENDNKW